MHHLILMLCLFGTLIDYPARRPYRTIVEDIKYHVKNGQFFSDTLVYVHENTHLIDGELFNQYHKPGFYVLNDMVFLIEEPKETLKEVADKIPERHRGTHYWMYCVKPQQHYTISSNILDEWNAYLNDVEACKQLKIPLDGNEKLVEELMVYSLYINDVDQEFLRHQLRRALALGAQVPDDLKQLVKDILREQPILSEHSLTNPFVTKTRLFG